MSSPVALNLHHHLPAAGLADQMDVAEDEDLAAVGVIAVERFLPQRRSPGQRSQDSGFSGYSGDSASEGSAASSNNSPVPAVVSSNASSGSAGKRSPLSDPEAAERALAEPVGRVLETDLDATPARLHVSRIYIRASSPESGLPAAPTSAAAVASLNLRDVLCEKNIQPVNLSGSESSSTSPDKCVGDKSLISAVLASTAGVQNRNNNNNHEADRSSDSQTALLLEHKSIVPPSSMRPNLSWKKLSESFRRVISSGRMMTATTTTSSHSCLPSVADGDESFTDEEKSRMLLLGKRSNLRRMKMDNETNDKEEEEEGRSCTNRVAMAESPQPTSRYLGGPRSSTPRKTLPADARHRRTTAAAVAAIVNNNNNNQRHCSRLGEDRPRVHWADIDPVVNSNDVLADGRRKQPQRPVNSHLAAVVTSWPDNSTWDSDTPSLEIGQQVTSHPTPLLMPAVPVPEQRKIRRGLRMGVGVDRSLNSTHVRKPIQPPVIHQHQQQQPMIIPAPAEFRSVPAVQPQTLPSSVLSHQPQYGLR